MKMPHYIVICEYESGVAIFFGGRFICILLSAKAELGQVDQ
jgi:hypothetical protein